MQTETVALAPFVSLFLILTVIFAATARTPKGITVQIAYRAKDCGDSRIVIAHVLLKSKYIMKPESRRMPSVQAQGPTDSSPSDSG